MEDRGDLQRLADRTEIRSGKRCRFRLQKAGLSRRDRRTAGLSFEFGFEDEGARTIAASHSERRMPS